MRLRFEPLTSEYWGDFENLFGARGACAGCWCMWWRLKRTEWTRNKGEGNRLAMKALVESGRSLGILAYDGELAVGWCAVEPRENYPVLENSRTLKRVDDRNVWSVTCFFVRKEYRKKGVSIALLKAAARHVREHGGS